MPPILKLACRYSFCGMCGLGLAACTLLTLL